MTKLTTDLINQPTQFLIILSLALVVAILIHAMNK